MESKTQVPLAKASYLCYLCGGEIRALDYLCHLPTCYYNYVTNLGGSPVCTCPNCQGREYHPKGGRAELTPPHSPSPVPTSAKRKLEKKETPKKKKDKKNGQHNDWIGKECFCCGKPYPDAELPILNLGAYRTMKFCVKKHVINNEDVDKIAFKIDEAIELIRKDGDHPLNSLTQLRDSTVQEEVQVLDEHCSGFSVLAPTPIKCNAKITSVPFYLVTKEKERRYFCKGTHAVRYVANFYCSKKEYY